MKYEHSLDVMPDMFDAYAIGEQIEQESKFLYECTKATLPLSSAGAACMLFKLKMDSGFKIANAWKHALVFYDNLSLIEEKKKT